MDDARKTRKNASPHTLRLQREAAGITAQYIHERSGRHARAAQDPRRAPSRPVRGFVQEGPAR